MLIFINLLRYIELLVKDYISIAIMEFDKKGILARAKAAAQETTAVMDEG